MFVGKRRRWHSSQSASGLWANLVADQQGFTATPDLPKSSSVRANGLRLTRSSLQRGLARIRNQSASIDVELVQEKRGLMKPVEYCESRIVTEDTHYEVEDLKWTHSASGTLM